MATTTIKTTGRTFVAKGREHESGLRQPAWQRSLLLVVLAYEGIGALVGGIMLVMAPDGRLLNMPLDIMHGAFADFLIPGIILTGLGALSVAAFVAVLQRTPADWIMSALALGGFIIWFWIEIAILLDIHWLHLMWGLPVIAGALAMIPLIPAVQLQRGLLIAGILSSVLYVVINLIVPARWEGYDSASRVVSELSAIGAPTAKLWAVLATPYTFLILAFALGVWQAGEGNRRLRIAGALLIAYGALGFLWPFAPMHMREAVAAGGANFSDTMHIALGAITQIIYLLALGFAAFALGRAFRIYSIATFVILLVFGALTFIDAPGLARNEPTPLIGVWERINIGVFLAWVVVLAVVLLRKEQHPETVRAAAGPHPATA